MDLIKNKLIGLVALIMIFALANFAWADTYQISDFDLADNALHNGLHTNHNYGALEIEIDGEGNGTWKSTAIDPISGDSKAIYFGTIENFVVLAELTAPDREGEVVEVGTLSRTKDKDGNPTNPGDDPEDPGKNPEILKFKPSVHAGQLPGIKSEYNLRNSSNTIEI